MRITTQGQVTIPIEIREQLGFLPQTEVSFVVDGTSVRLVKSGEPGGGRGRQIVDHLTGRGSARMTTEETLALTPDLYRKVVWTRSTPGRPRVCRIARLPGDWAWMRRPIARFVNETAHRHPLLLARD